MLEPIRHVLNSKVIVLASASPRRKTVLDITGLNFKVVPSDAEENVDKVKFPQPWTYTLQTAKLKAEAVAARLKDESVDLIIGADTVVALDSTIYGKPDSKDKAKEILSLLSGKTHTVYTGVALITPTASHAFYEATDVTMDDFDEAVIEGYVSTGEPMDKAGAYGIQELGGTLVKEIRGDYYNVMGFPLHRFCKTLREIYPTKT